MSRKIEREIEFTDWWFNEHKKAPTYADAIEWAEKEMIEKACEWLRDNLKNYASFDTDMIKDLKKAMGYESKTKA